MEQFMLNEVTQSTLPMIAFTNTIVKNGVTINQEALVIITDDEPTVLLRLLHTQMNAEADTPELIEFRSKLYHITDWDTQPGTFTEDEVEEEMDIRTFLLGVKKRFMDLTINGRKESNIDRHYREREVTLFRATEGLND